jgi:hypothetical protein
LLGRMMCFVTCISCQTTLLAEHHASEWLCHMLPLVLAKVSQSADAAPLILLCCCLPSQHQAHQVNHHIRASGLKVDVVIVSPLTRALETAVGCFGNLAAAAPDIPQEPAAASSASSSNGSKRLPLMRAITAVPGKRAAHPAVSSEGCPPMVVHELCRWAAVCLS